MRPLAFLASTLLVASTALAQSTDTRCTNLQQLHLDHAKVNSAEVVTSGAFIAPPRPTGKAEQVALYKKIPAFCRVKVEATPTSDSRINIEVWLPAEGWNHRFLALGNGGFAGEIDYE